MENTSNYNPWLVALGIIVGLGVFAGLFWSIKKLWVLNKQLMLFRGTIRGISLDKHQQVKAVNAVLNQVLAFSNLSVIPKIYRMPIIWGSRVLTAARR